MQQDIYNKEFTIRQIFSESWKRFKENFSLILLITVIVYIPVNILLAFIPFDALLEQFGTLRGFRMYMRAIAILESFIGILATMAIAYAIKNAIDGKKILLGEAFKKSFSRWGAAIGTNIVAGVFLFGLTLLLIVPGIIYSVYWLFILYAVILQNKSGKSALDYSVTIVRGRWWKVAGYATVISLISFFAGIFAVIPYLFLPDNFFTNVTTDTLIDIVASYFTVVFIIFFINFDGTKKEVIPNQSTNP